MDVLWRQPAPLGDRLNSTRLFAQVQVRAGGFRGQTDAAIVQDHLSTFLTQLRRLHETSRGIAELPGVNGQFNLRLRRDTQGLIELAGEVADQPGASTRLRFIWRFDRRHLGDTIRDLTGVIAQFAVSAAPGPLAQQCA